MKKITIIPAIDMIEGKCVRLSKGDYDTKKIYNENPLEVAKMFEYNGIQRLHLVDLDGAKAGHIVNYKVLETISTNTSLTIDFGGGLKTSDDLRIAFDCGAHMVTGGSIAVKNPTEFENWIRNYGNKIILGADAKDGKIAVSGWTEQTTETLIDFIRKYTKLGIKNVISTEISRDGMLTGPAIDLYKDIITKINDIQLIASGGVSEINDVKNLQDIGCSGVIIGKAIYENRISLPDLQKYL